METIIRKVDKHNIDMQIMQEAGEILKKGGKTLPVTFKFGSDEQPEYHTFTQLEELKDFYTKAVGFIQTVLAEGWEKKDKFNLELYRIE